MGEVSAAYAGCRGRIGELVRGLDDERAATPVPTCPGWSVHDVVAHLAGVVDDALAGRLAGAGGDAWTAAQVEARRGVPVADIVAEWDANAPAFEAVLDAIAEVGRQVIADVVSHEHDIRLALDAPGAQDTDAVGIGLAFAANRVVAEAAASGVALRVTSADGSEFGPPDAEVALTGEPFELLRAASGRRTAEQLLAMKWEGDPEPAIPAFSWLALRLASEPIEE